MKLDIAYNQWYNNEISLTGNIIRFISCGNGVYFRALTEKPRAVTVGMV